MAKNEVENIKRIDLFGGFLLITSLLFPILWIQFQNTYFSLLLFFLIILGIIIIGYYIQKVKTLILAINTPIANTFVTLGGIISLYQLAIQFNFSTNFKLPIIPWYWSIILIFTGIIFKLFLLDEAFQYFIKNITLKNQLRGGLIIIAIVLAIAYSLTKQDIYILYSTCSLSLIALSDPAYKKEVKTHEKIFVIFSSILILLMFVIFDNAIFRISLIILFVSIFIWGISIKEFIANISNLLNHIYLGLIIVINYLRNKIKSSITWIVNHPIQAVKELFLISSIILVLLFIYTSNQLYLLVAIICFAIRISQFLKKFMIWIVSSLKSMILAVYNLIREIFNLIYRTSNKFYNWVLNNKFLAFRILLLILSIPAFILIDSKNNYNIIVFSVLITLGILPSLILPIKNFSINLIKFTRSLLNNIISSLHELFIYVKSNPYGIIKGVTYLSSIGIWLFKPFNSLSTNSNNLISFILFIVAIILTFPNSIISIKNKLINYLTDVTRLFGLSGVSFLILAMFIENPLLSLVFIILSSIFLSFSWENSIPVMIGLILQSFTHFIHHIFMFFSRFRNFGYIISFISWILLILSFFYNFIFDRNDLIRISIFVLSICLWNLAYPHRRYQFIRLLKGAYNFIYSMIYNIMLTGYKILKSIFRSLYNNLILVIIWLVAFALALIGISLILPSLHFIAELIFDDLTTNKLASFIVGLSLIGISSLTFQQTYKKRSVISFQQEVK